MRAWVAEGKSIHVLNFFTVSEYAPQLPPSSREQITRQRQKEDEASLRALSPAITQESLELLDAPLRSGLPFDRLMTPTSVEFVNPLEVAGLAREIASRANGGLVIAPLALGDHIDHHTVRLAGLKAIPPSNLVFYDDLPYATWTPEEDIQERVHYRQPCVTEPCKQFKLQLVGSYRSQVTLEEARLIAGYRERYWTQQACHNTSARGHSLSTHTARV